jgi:hypothetical protein
MFGGFVYGWGRGIINTLNLAGILDFFHRILKLYCAASTVTSVSDTDKNRLYIHGNMWLNLYRSLLVFCIAVYDTIQNSKSRKLQLASRRLCSYFN